MQTRDELVAEAIEEDIVNSDEDTPDVLLVLGFLGTGFVGAVLYWSLTHPQETATLLWTWFGEH